jgi:hypothetical protein
MYCLNLLIYYASCIGLVYRDADGAAVRKRTTSDKKIWNRFLETLLWEKVDGRMLRAELTSRGEAWLLTVIMRKMKRYPMDELHIKNDFPEILGEVKARRRREQAEESAAAAAAAAADADPHNEEGEHGFDEDNLTGHDNPSAST